MFTINVAIPKPISINKNAYISSIKFKILDFNIKKEYSIEDTIKIKKISYDHPSHSQR